MFVLQVYCSKLLQVSLHENQQFIVGVDKLVAPQTPVEATVVQRYHSWIGSAFISWIDREPAALSKHIQVLRDAATLEIFLLGTLNRHGVTVQVHLPLQSAPVVLSQHCISSGLYQIPGMLVWRCCE